MGLALPSQGPPAAGTFSAHSSTGGGHVWRTRLRAAQQLVQGCTAGMWIFMSVILQLRPLSGMPCL